jgi:hypothetical protein
LHERARAKVRAHVAARCRTTVHVEFLDNHGDAIMHQLIPLTEPEKMQAAGLPFRSTDSAYWCFRNAEKRGLSKAFVRIGRRVYVDPAKFHELARARA